MKVGLTARDRERRGALMVRKVVRRPVDSDPTLQQPLSLFVCGKVAISRVVSKREVKE